jgi:hypothetical protein
VERNKRNATRTAWKELIRRQDLLFDLDNLTIQSRLNLMKSSYIPQKTSWNTMQISCSQMRKCNKIEEKAAFPKWQCRNLFHNSFLRAKEYRKLIEPMGFDQIESQKHEKLLNGMILSDQHTARNQKKIKSFFMEN